MPQPQAPPPVGRVLPGATVAISALSAVFVVAGLAGWATGGVDGDPVGFVVVAVGFGVPGAWLGLVRRAAPVGCALSVVGLSGASMLASGAALHQGDATWAAWVGSWAWAPGLATAAVVLPLLLPDGRPPSPRWRPVRHAAVTVVTAYTAVLAVRPGPLEGGPEHENPVAVDLPGGLETALAATLGVLALAGVASLVAHWRGRDPGVRHELAWLLVAVVALLGYYVAVDLVPALLVLAPVAPVVLPAGILAGVLLHGMYDVDRLLVRALVAACLTALVLAASLLTAVLAGAAVDTDGRVTRAAIVTGVVALGFGPARQRARRLVNRLVHGHDDDPLATLQRLGDRLALALPAEDAVRVVVDAVAAELRPSYVALDLLHDGRVVRSARTGDSTARGEDVLLPVHHRGDIVAELVVRPRVGGLDPRGRRVLEQLVRSAAPALRAALLTEQLQRSREQLVLAREEERRRLRRDLHDGLGALLTGLSMSAAALEQCEPAQDRREQLQRIGHRLDDARAEVRRLLDDLRPRDLDELGLADALRVVAEQLGGPATGPHAVLVDVDVVQPLGPLGAEVEVAAYRIVSEALSNAVRHGGAARVHVRVQHDDDLLVEVRDDGTGLHPDDVPGVGLASMRQRAAELGGSCVVRNDDELGTVVRAVLPVQR